MIAGLLFDSTWHSLVLLLSGYALGSSPAWSRGVCIGWFAAGPLLGNAGAESRRPDSGDGLDSARDGRFAIGRCFRPSALIALAVWFPVTMLTASGISNTRASYLDVARTLGASRGYLIFRVAIPAAMPSIFIGLFMGLGARF